MATPRQVAANRQNAQKSTGPKTEEGKNASRQNAIKHGLAGDGPVVREVFTEHVAKRMEAFRSAFPTYNELDEWALEQVTLLTFRITHAQRVEAQLVFDAQNRAIDHWDDDQFLHAQNVGRRLAKDPAGTVFKLSTFKHGCLWLADAWSALLPFATPELWTEVHDQRVHDLSSHDPEFRGYRPWKDRLEAYVTEQAEYYEAQAEAYELADMRARQNAIDGTPLAPSAELSRVRRYEASLSRRFDQLTRRLDQSSQRAEEHGRALLPVPPKRVSPPTLKPADVSLAGIEVLPVSILPASEEPVSARRGSTTQAHVAPRTPIAEALAPKHDREEGRNRRKRRREELEARKRARQAAVSRGTAPVV